MATIKIGDKTCEFEPPKTILQVALENDIEIPHYCYHPDLTVVASCRICLAEVAQPNPRNDNKLEPIPKLVPTCQQPAVDGAEVYLKSDKTVANQKAVMEYLLINHPLDCPVCDQAGECHLQDYSYKYGRAASRFEESKVKQPKKDIGEHVLLYADRCIMCTRCVRFTREISGGGELGVQGRGHTEQIDIFPGKALDDELSGNVVDICPVGALLDKDFLFDQRVWYLTSTPSIDPITCSGDNLWIDHNEGRVWRLKPRENLDVNRHWTSNEIRYGWKFVHDEKRLTMPAVKVGGSAVEKGWPEASDAAAAGLKDKKIAALISPMISCEDAHLVAQLARAIDAEARFVIGPVPVDGEDKTFPAGYTVYAEKAPNARGVRRVLKQLTGQDPLEFDQFQNAARDAQAVILTGNYPSEWANRPLMDALSGKFTVLIDTLASQLTQHADVVLPASTWAEKDGTFENVNHRLQAFAQAIPPLEFTRPEGQVALDLLAKLGHGEPTRFDAARVRGQIGGELTEVAVPQGKESREPAMQFVEL